MSLEDTFKRAVKDFHLDAPDHLVMKYISIARLIDETPGLLGLHVLMTGLVNDHREAVNCNSHDDTQDHFETIYEALEELGGEFEIDEDDDAEEEDE